ncbi:glutaredoxin domain-containing protein [Oceanihabitans sp. 2_MG-2023]|uniref:glutaredoxin family protein n=1 Tax=Oceanihabitans sp. 2_MG-2023 TaxID=3062661 RepID=UPI0026E2D66A|nr:glutaredoxin domain-containing protein [Oceanihabitans sp. 2_MG-2023]MDO6597620.1 glutaredoxin domain-containing protein [Oceanihabitans sp. 2_MG-2023]
MKKITFYFLLFFVSASSFAQNNHAHISIEKKEKGKHVAVYAVNSSATDYEVFIKINAAGYRKIAQNAVTKIVPANSEVKMASLIKISDESNLSFGMIVNEIGHDKEKIANAIDFTFEESKKNKPVIVFVKDYCDLCDNTIQLFSDNNIVHTIYNIDEDKEYYQKIQQELLNRKNDKTSLVPIIEIEDSIYNRLESRDKLIKALKNHF